MSPYPDEMSLHDARELFFRLGNLGPDGGYSSRWVRLETKPFPFYFPNWGARVAAARLHDLHHIAADYATDWPGEVEISAWEIASGCAHFHAAWILDLGGFYAGIFIAPTRLFRAFLRGRRARTNLYQQGFDNSCLKEMTVGMLRDQLGLRVAPPKANAKDIGLFLFWCLASLLIWLPPWLLGLVLVWLIVRRLL
jgi:hypothetical protein